MYLTRIDLQPQVRTIWRALGDCQRLAIRILTLQDAA